MLNLGAVIDNLSRLENLSTYIPSVIQLSILLFWVFIIRRSKTPYSSSLALSLFLLLISVVMLLLTFTSVAKTLSEYSFLFLGAGIIQMLFMKYNDS